MVPPGQTTAVQLFSGHGDNNHNDWARVCQTTTVPTDGNTCLNFLVAGVFENYHYLNQANNPNGDGYLEVRVFLGAVNCNVANPGNRVLFDVLLNWEYLVGNNLVTLDGLLGNQAGTYGYATQTPPGSGTGGCEVNPGDPTHWGIFPWTPYTLNLCPYAGQQITIEITSYDCNEGGHYTWGYFDCPTWSACAPASVTLAKSNNPTGVVNAGQTITYTLNYRNASSTNYDDGVVIFDTVPAGTGFVSNSQTSNPFMPVTFVTGNVVGWDVGYLKPGASGTLSFSVTVDNLPPGSCAGTIVNQAGETDFVTCYLTPTILTSNAVTNRWGFTCTPTSTPTSSPTRTASRTPTLTSTPSPTLTPSNTPTMTPTNSPSTTPTMTPTRSPTLTPTTTNTPSDSPTHTSTQTATSTATSSATSTATASRTSTATKTSTTTATLTATASATKTATLTTTSTATNSSTSTTTSTATNTLVNTATASKTATTTATSTATRTATLTWTSTASFTATNTATLTTTSTPTSTFTATHTPTRTPTATATSTATSTSTVTLTPTASPTSTATSTATNTYTLTPTSTPTLTFTTTYTPTQTPTATATSTDTLTPTATSTSTATLTPTPTATLGVTLAKQVSSSWTASGKTLTYTLSLNVVGNGASGITVTDTLPAQMTYVGPSTNNPPSLPAPVSKPALNQLVWTLPELAPGSYQLSYQAQVDNMTPPGTTLTNFAVLTYPGAQPVTADAQAVVTSDYTVKVGVYNEAGELVDSLTTEQVSQPIESLTLNSAAITELTGPGGSVTVYYAGTVIGVWNGNSSSGTPVSNGAYIIKADNIDGAGNVTTVSQEVTVSRSYASTTVNIYNEAGEIVRHLYSQIANNSGTEMTTVNLSSSVLRAGIAPPDPTSIVQILIRTSGNSVTVGWDGSNDLGARVTDGHYEIQVHWNDGQGGNEDITRGIVVMGAGHLDKVVAEPNILTGSNLTALFEIQSTTSYTLQARIYTIAGEFLKLLKGQEGTNQVSWNASGLSSGTYIAVIELISPQGGVAGRQTLKVLVIH